MSDPRFVVILTVVGGIAAAGSVASRCVSDETKQTQRITVRARDIPKSVQILGNFGQPLGSLLTVRGKWTRPGAGVKGRTVKDPSLVFHITLVNGQVPDEQIELHGLLVNPIFRRRSGGGPKPGESWDWRYASGSKPAPTPADGETWEMLGVETGHFNWYSHESWEEIGGPTVQEAPCLQGFYTPFEFIAVRKVR